MSTPLTEHFFLEELTITSHREYDNTPPEEIRAHLLVLAQGMEKVRRVLGTPISINSGYRSPAVNKVVGGAENSAHKFGYAADFTCWKFGTPLAICRAIVASGVAFDQIIEEGSWVHISFDPREDREGRMRHEVLTKKPGGGYRPGLG